MNPKVVRLVTSGVLIALGTTLSIIEVWKMPFGGSVTLFGMVPIVVLAYKYGARWGLLSAFVFSILQMVLGAAMTNAFAGLNGMSLVYMALLDYVVAYVVLGFAGMFKNKIKNQTLSIVLGTLVCTLLRFFCHFMSGVVLWGEYAKGFFEQMNTGFADSVLSNLSGTGIVMMYSLVYNVNYMLPEILITLAGVVVLMSIKPLRKQVIDDDLALRVYS